uniref:WW domain-binding protein 11 n=1 Tax=Gorilla gorilla gorilla TaxID=9595 RepID=A0A2I2YRD5_GORGO
MEWRSTSSTKSGNFMNPIDQAQKEARKRELKKSKKQHMMVPAPPQLNEKVLKDKCKKLRETFGILQLYEKENPDIYKELRKLEVEYKQKRAQLSQYFDAVKNVMIMMFLAPVKMMAILRTWIKISMMKVLMTVTPTDQMEKVRRMNLCTMMMVRETTMKKRSQVLVYSLQICGKSRKRRRT